MMRTKISSDISELEHLHNIYKWIPGKDNIRPLPEIIENKKKFIDNIKFFYVEEIDYILADIFDYPSKMTTGLPEQSQSLTTGLPEQSQSLTEQSQNKGKLYVIKENIQKKHIFIENMFPYNLPQETEHYVIWYSYNSIELTDEKINTDIESSIKNLLNHDDFEFIWYENPKRTINFFHHLQVFWKNNNKINN